jgi:hypothetical protein
MGEISSKTERSPSFWNQEKDSLWMFKRLGTSRISGDFPKLRLFVWVELRASALMRGFAGELVLFGTWRFLLLGIGGQQSTIRYFSPRNIGLSTADFRIYLISSAAQAAFVALYSYCLSNSSNKHQATASLLRYFLMNF